MCKCVDKKNREKTLYLETFRAVLVYFSTEKKVTITASQLEKHKYCINPSILIIQISHNFFGKYFYNAGLKVTFVTVFTVRCAWPL